jgi:hypothetical protein
MTRSSTPGRSRWRRWLPVILGIPVVGGAVGTAAVATDTFRAGYYFGRAVAHVDLALFPPSDRTTPPTVEVTDAPSPSPTPMPSLAPGATPTPAPVRRPVDVRIVPNPNAVFASEIQDTFCAAAGVQMALTILGHGSPSNAFQRTLESRVGEWDSYRDSHDGGWGPSAMSLALAAYGVPGYQVRAYTTRAAALRDAAAALTRTHEPVLLIAWYGAHTWVMSGYRATADPTIFPDAQVTGTYILDPWYPRISSIWGPSDPPGTFQNAAEMVRNYLPWKRPEGLYRDRDGKFIAVVPTVTG